LDAALGVVDEQGLNALSMRRLARELGVEAMSLYNHFRSKDALVAALVDRVMAEVDLPEQDDDWTAWVRELGRRIWSVLDQRPSLMPALVAGQALGTQLLRLCDALFEQLHRAGLGEDDQALLWELLKNQVFGSLAQRELGGGPAFPVGDYPHIARAMVAMTACDVQQTFEQGLDFIIEAMAARLRGDAGKSVTTR
jgi:AcrR family transcriptional regulator